MKKSKKKIISILNFDTLININYYYSSDKINTLNRNIKPNILISNIYYSILLFFIIWVKKISTIKSYTVPLKKASIIFMSYTKNQRDAINKLTPIIDDAVVVGNKKFGNVILSEYKAFFYAVPFFFDVWKKYKQSKKYIRNSFKYIFHHYWLTYGYLIMLIDYLERHQTKLVVVSNDHSMRTRVPIFACKALGIKSLYLQHASIGNTFPRLIYDYALLEGQDALDKYSQIGKIDSIVFLIGSLKMSNKISINTKTNIDVIGLCFGLNDNLKIVENVIKELLKIFNPSKIILRSHPRETRISFTKNMKKKYQIRFSESKQTNVIDFLQETDCIISGESNIHLEAAYMNILPIFHVLSDDIRESFDVYGFIKNKLISHICKSPKELSNLLYKLKMNRPNVRHLTKYYNATLGTKYEKKVTDLYHKVISSIKSGDSKFINKHFNYKIKNGVQVYSLKK